jgi:hypothetical protein
MGLLQIEADVGQQLEEGRRAHCLDRRCPVLRNQSC